MNLIKNHSQIVVRVISLVVGVALFVFVFRDIDIVTTWALISHVGYFFIVILSLYLLGSFADAFAWKILLESSSPKSISYIRLLLIHIAGESFYRFLPAGVVVGESIKALLLRKHSTILYPTIISSLMMRKLLMGISQAFYIGFAVVLGVILIKQDSNNTLIQIGIVISFVLLILFIVIGYFLFKGNLGASLYKLLIKIPIKSVKKKVSQQQNIFISTDKIVRESISKRRGKSVMAFFLFLFVWFTELAETYIILIALSASISFSESLVFEPIVSFLRSVVFFIPAGLGIMDFGYSTLLQSISNDASGTVVAAFIITKRAKELFWIIVGVSLTVMLGKHGNDRTVNHIHATILPDLAVALNTNAKH